MAGEKYTTAQVIKAIEDSAGIKAVVARRLGCHRFTVDRYIRRYPTVARAYQQEREKLVDLAESELVKRVRAGEWPAIRWVLATLGRNRGYVEKQEMDVTSGGEPIRVIGGVNLDEL